MVLFDYARILFRRWWLVVLPVVLIGGITLLTIQPPVSSYQVKVRFAVGLPPEQVPDVYNFDRHYDWLASECILRAVFLSFPNNSTMYFLHLEINSSCFVS